MERRRTFLLFSIVLALLGGLLLRPLPADAMVYDDEVASTVVSGPVTTEADTVSDATPNAGPTIDVWYTSSQTFGQLGRPQTWVNILGNVSDPDGVNSLHYSLNGGPQRNLSMGPDTRRLAQNGDFNIDIAYAQLQNGLNEVLITAQDNKGEQTTVPVDLQVTQGQSWPLPYIVDWAAVGNLQAAVQVVDGRWGVSVNGLHTDQVDYDRTVAIGDMAWSDYEVTVPVTIHSIDTEGYNYPSYGPGVGFLLRWQGHTDDPIPGWQPKTGWQPFGAIGWYRYQNDATGDRLQLLGDGNRIIKQDTTGRKLSTGVPYIFKMRAETKPGQGTFYGLKVWVSGQAEPSGWDVSGYEPVTDLANGSFLLLAHHVEATYGDVTVTQLNTVNLTVTVQGSGTVQRDPDRSSYYVGEPVKLTPIPVTGWTFDGWTGPNGGEPVSNGDGTYTLTMTGNMALTAIFSPPTSLNLTIAIDGQGNVSHTPGNPYSYGEVATLEPVPAPGWVFDGWSGPDAGDPVYNGNGTWSLVMDSAKALTARFTQPTFYVTVAVLGQGTVSNSPGNPYLSGQVATLRPNPVTGWSFTGWSGDNASDLVQNKDGTWSLVMDGDKAVTATFTQIAYDLNISIVGQGAVGRSPLPPYPAGTLVMLQPNPAAGWRFEGWSGANASDPINNGNGTWSLPMDGAKSLTATFSNRYQLALSVNGEGTIGKAPDQSTYAYGQRVTVTPLPAPGWRFNGWTGPASGQLTDNGDGTWSLTIDGDKLLLANFVLGAYLLEIEEVLGDGTVSPPAGTYPHNFGDVVTLSATPGVGWRFDGWSGTNGDQVVENGNGTYSLNMNGDKSVQARFAPLERSLSIQAPLGTGTVEPAEGTYLYYHGDTATLTPIPALGWSFVGWRGPNGPDVVDNGDGTWSLLMDEDKTIQAEFALRQLQVNLVYEGLGVVRNLPGNPYTYGDLATLEPLPAPGWTFGGWAGQHAHELWDNGDGSWTLTMDGDKDLIANFAKGRLFLPLIVHQR